MPRRGLSRTRLAGVAVGLAAAASQFGQVGNAGRSAEFHRLSAAALAGLLVVLVVTAVRGRSGWWSVPLVPALVVVAAAGLQDPLAGLALALSSVVVLSLYGSAAEWAARVLGAVVAVPTAVAISPLSAGREISWHSGTVLGLLPQVLLMAALSRGIHAALRRQERDAARESLLARAGHARLVDGLEIDPQAVMMIALLHDVLEDTPRTAADLRAAGFAEPVVAAVRILTKPAARTAYSERIGQVIAADDLAAILVKMSDNEDNLGPERTLPEAAFLRDFAGDLPEARARVLFAVQQPFRKSLLAGRTSQAAWRAKPSFYAVSTEDRTIDPDLQRFMARRMGAETIELKASHLSLISQPDAVTALILRAAGHA